MYISPSITGKLNVSKTQDLILLYTYILQPKNIIKILIKDFIKTYFQIIEIMCKNYAVTFLIMVEGE